MYPDIIDPEAHFSITLLSAGIWTDTNSRLYASPVEGNVILSLSKDDRMFFMINAWNENALIGKVYCRDSPNTIRHPEPVEG